MVWPSDDYIERVDALSGPCSLCEIRCGAMRASGHRGQCGLADETYVYNHLLHFGEESELIPSYTIYLSGCSMACSFCSEAEHLVPPFSSRPADPVALAQKVAPRLARARNINFVGGEPTIQLGFIARFAHALDQLGVKVPLLCNTNGYLTEEALDLCMELFSVWVVDLKFGNNRCARRVAGTDRYLEVLGRTIQTVEASDAALWVRHLLMPGHLECCTKPSLAWLDAHAPGASVNVMPAFHPFRHERNERWQVLTDSERDEGRSLLLKTGLSNTYYDGQRISR